MDEFVVHAGLFGRPVLRLDGLRPQMRLEIQYGLQCRADAGRIRTKLADLQPLTKFLTATGANSLTERTPEQWQNEFLTARGDFAEVNRFVRTVSDQLDMLVNGIGWDVEYPRDVWRLNRLGFDAKTESLKFDRISQLWLRELAKKWLRNRLTVGRSKHTTHVSLAAIVSLSVYLQGHASPPTTPAELTRDHLEGWLAERKLAIENSETRRGYITNVSVFLRDVHRKAWAPDLPVTTQLYPEDNVERLRDAAARAIPEYVMRQLESDEKLGQIRDPNVRAIVEIMLNCGLRGGDARQLDFSCVVRDGDDNPYLRFLNHKMRRTTFVPLDDHTLGVITAQQGRVLQRFPQGCTRLIPAHLANPDGSRPYAPGTFGHQIRSWLDSIQLVDERQMPVYVTAHQLRHTFATRLINRDVPQHIVQKLLDHESPEMTAHYARLCDDKLREAWLKARKINSEGQEVELDEDHPLAGAEWTRAGLDKAKTTLPNGYCGMPAHSPCEHANPCLTCPLFLTTPDFLPQHQAQRSATLQLITKAEAEGHHRVVEKNTQLLGNLDRIISACEGCHSDQIVIGGTARGGQRAHGDAS
ncbi:tyrosine-type recombinase/integrase [Mycobacteroides stephanolepidis]|nr:tyrosine-type recombinase/integrase [[Mycobacterium] stephanolepidis]